MYSIFDRFQRNDHPGSAPVAGTPHTEQIRRRGPTLAVVLTLACWFGAVPCLIGCGSGPNRDSPDVDVAEARRVFEADAISAEELAALDGDTDFGGSGVSVKGGPGSAFTILLTGVPSSMRLRPDVALERVASAVDMPGVRLMEQKGDRPPLIVVGRYADPDGDEAQRDLRKVRALKVDGRTPFTGAVLVAEVDSAPTDTRLARHDLRQAKKLTGEEATYTLQIGVYAREDERRPSAADLASFREAAEDAVTRLRREGEEAYFYHGPNGSMVTVGVFNDDDIDTSVVPPIESNRLENTRRRHPNNLLNGRGVRELRGDGGRGDPRLQPSRLVLIPD